MTGSPRDGFQAAARAFARQVRDIPESAWDGPGLGEWDLRALVGHTSRSLITVSGYLKTPADHEDVASAVEYYTKIRDYLAGTGAGDIVDRGRQAGRDLGADPVATIDGLLAQVLADLDAVAEAGDPLIAVIGGLGIRLSSYLPTRTFELAVHGLDISRATGITLALPDEVLEQATTLAARVSVALGQGAHVLLALTGRAALPDAFSVV